MVTSLADTRKNPIIICPEIFLEFHHVQKKKETGSQALAQATLSMYNPPESKSHLAFRLTTNRRHRYITRPSKGILFPGDQQTVIVTLTKNAQIETYNHNGSSSEFESRNGKLQKVDKVRIEIFSISSFLAKSAKPMSPDSVWDEVLKGPSFEPIILRVFHKCSYQLSNKNFVAVRKGAREKNLNGVHRFSHPDAGSDFQASNTFPLPLKNEVQFENIEWPDDSKLRSDTVIRANDFTETTKESKEFSINENKNMSSFRLPQHQFSKKIPLSKFVPKTFQTKNEVTHSNFNWGTNNDPIYDRVDWLVRCASDSSSDAADIMNSTKSSFRENVDGTLMKKLDKALSVERRSRKSTVGNNNKRGLFICERRLTKSLPADAEQYYAMGNEGANFDTSDISHCERSTDMFEDFSKIHHQSSLRALDEQKQKRHAKKSRKGLLRFLNDSFVFSLRGRFKKNASLEEKQRPCPTQEAILQKSHSSKGILRHADSNRDCCNKAFIRTSSDGNRNVSWSEDLNFTDGNEKKIHFHSLINTKNDRSDEQPTSCTRRTRSSPMRSSTSYSTSPLSSVAHSYSLSRSALHTNLSLQSTHPTLGHGDFTRSSSLPSCGTWYSSQQNVLHNQQFRKNVGDQSTTKTHCNKKVTVETGHSYANATNNQCLNLEESNRSMDSLPRKKSQQNKYQPCKIPVQSTRRRDASQSKKIKYCDPYGPGL